MKILHVTDQRYRSSGVSVFCIELCDALVDMGVNLKLALQRPGFKSPYPVRHEEMLTDTESIIRNPVAFDWEIVHINGVWNWPYHQIAKIAYKHRVPIVWSPHGSLTPWALKHKWLKKQIAWQTYQKRDLSRSCALHVTAQSEVDDMRRLGLKNDIIVQPLGVNLRWGDAEVEAIKDRVSERRLFYLSRLHPKKGVDNLIRAWARLKSESSDATVGWKVMIAGEDAYPGYSESLRHLCREVGVDGDFKFVGAIYGDEKDRAFAEARAFVLPSHSENFGSVVIEALANGTPVVTTKGTPWAGLEMHGCGWWIDVGVEPLAGVLKEIMRIDDAKLRAMGRRGREWVKCDFAWSAISRKMYRSYEWVCGNGGRPNWIVGH